MEAFKKKDAFENNIGKETKRCDGNVWFIMNKVSNTGPL